MSEVKPEVLLVEDYDDLVTGFRYIFRDIKDIAAVYAENGKEALTLLLKNPNIRCVLLDYTMPQMNGLEFLEEKKKIDAIKDIPVIFQTAQPDYLFLPLVPLDASVAAFFNKPYEPEDMFAIVRQIIFENKGSEFISAMQTQIQEATIKAEKLGYY